MKNLPNLPFELILSYLSLKQLIRSKLVSRRWYAMISSFRVKRLCFTEHPNGFINQNRWISCVSAQNIISSPRFEPFFATIAKSIVSLNLKSLHLFCLHLNRKSIPALANVLNSFGRLDELSLTGVYRLFESDPNHQSNRQSRSLKLNLSMLNRIQLEAVFGIKSLTLDAPKLQKAKIIDCPSNFRLHLVHGESLEWLFVDEKVNLINEVKKLKNVKFFYYEGRYMFDSRLLVGLEQLKEIHLNGKNPASWFFKPKPHKDCAHLKIYLWGLLLTGPQDPAINSNFNSLAIKETLGYLADNHQRLADLIPFQNALWYEAIERVPPQLTIDLLNRLTDLNKLIVDKPIQDVERFLDLLKKFTNIVALRFECEQPQDLFDRLSEHCAVQKLRIRHRPAALSFLLKLNSLIHLHLDWSIDLESVRKLFKSLKCLSELNFKYIEEKVRIRMDHRKRFQTFILGRKVDVAKLKTGIKFIIRKMPEKSRNVEELKNRFLSANPSYRRRSQLD